jgi:hypothetical protein
MLKAAINLKGKLRRRTRLIKGIIAEKITERWQEKSLNGQF